MENLPLVRSREEGHWILDHHGGQTLPQFLYQVLSLAAELPERRYAINTCSERRGFLTGFCAALVRGQTALFPANTTDGAVTELAEQYPDSYIVTDEDRSYGLQTIDVSGAMDLQGTTAEIPMIPGGHPAAVLQTSGSTGIPQPHEKFWSELVIGAKRLSQRFQFGTHDLIVTTVPAQHMYGFETSVMLPLQSGAAVYTGHTLYPMDIAGALTRGDGAASLITTPVHLSACYRSGNDWPATRRVICSTAPLDSELARDCEDRLATPVEEIYGSTETGAVATRRTVRDERWRCLDGLRLQDDDGNLRLHDTSATASRAINDEIELVDDRHFILRGRPADLLKIAGKRASMGDLNSRLNSIPGLIDGIFVVRASSGATVPRLVAIVVAPNLTEKAIRDELALHVDPAFLPRRIYRVQRLPRNSTGKLPDTAISALVAELEAAA